MEKIKINGKTYKYGGWAECAYEFMLLSGEVASNELTPQSELTKIIKKSKELRGKDFLSIASKKMITYLHNYDIYKNIYIPEITAEYMKEFAKSDIMQADVEILINIIQSIQKLYTHLKIPFDMTTYNNILAYSSKTIDETIDETMDETMDETTNGAIDETTNGTIDETMDETTNNTLHNLKYIEYLQILLINLIEKLIIFY